MSTISWPGRGAFVWTCSAILLCGLWLPCTLQARELVVRVVDAHGTPLQYAAVLANWTDGRAAPASAKPVAMMQKNLRFQPLMMIVPAGSSVTFLNYDHTRHHVYSFSQAKRFDIKLYVGKPDREISFDTPGVVTIGCNIHDQMQAFIVVNDQPVGVVTDGAGYARLKNLPDKPITLSIWHPWMPGEHVRKNQTSAADQAAVTVRLDVDPPPPLPHGGHHSLQDRFDQLSGQP